MTTGVIFDIQRFALHDGEGIRTVIFFKGCPLRCAWCCNPESQSCKPQLSYSVDKCVECMRCKARCKQGALGVGSVVAIKHNLCTLCGECVGECVHGALRIVGREVTCDQVMEEIMKDKSYYDLSGGGVTLSGGEALMQGDFALSLLVRCRQLGVRCSVETCAVVDRAVLDRAVEYVDCFMVDFKHSDTTLHREYVGIGNERVLDTIAFLSARGARIVLRCPIIPSVNDTKEHFAAIAQFSNRYGAIESVEIMPYHNFGLHKYAELSMVVKQFVQSSVDSALSAIWEEEVIKNGCTKLKCHG